MKKIKKFLGYAGIATMIVGLEYIGTYSDHPDWSISQIISSISIGDLVIILIGSLLVLFINWITQ